MEATAQAASSAAHGRTVPARLPLWVLIGAFLGILAGITFGERTAVFRPLGDVYAMMLLSVVYPYILSSLIVGLGSLATGRAWRLLQASWGVYLFLWVAVFAAIFVLAQHPDLSKRGFLSFVFDGRYKFARYYAPAAFNTPQTLDQIFKYNDVQLFDLSDDPDELHNLALERDKYKDTILRMNALLNDLMAKEVGKNDGAFLPAAVRPKQTVVFDKQ